MRGRKSVQPIPDGAIPVREVGPWTIYVSKADRSFYIQTADRSVEPLKLSLDEILHLIKGMSSRSLTVKKQPPPSQSDEGRELSETDRHKRQFKRFIRRCEAEFSAGGVRIRGIASDFSFSGLFLKTNYPASPDTTISLALHLPDGSTSYLKGRVKRSMKTALGKVTGLPVKSLKNGMGVELIEKDSAYLNFIRSLVHKE